MELTMTDAEMGALLGASYTNLQEQGSVFLDAPVGKQWELKNISFDDPADGIGKYEVARELRIKAAKSYESDGWAYDDNHTSQGFVSGGKVHARYRRYVDPT
jgi:hypothetical protein